MRCFTLVQWTVLILAVIGVASTAVGNSAPLVIKIEVVGNEYLSTGVIKDHMRTKEDRWFTLFGRRRLDERTLELDLVRIKALYRQHGFLDPEVERRLVYAGDSSWVTVEISLAEGFQTMVGEIEFSGNYLFSDERLMQEISSAKGSPLGPARLDEDRRSIQLLYAENGHPYAQVSVDHGQSEDSREGNVTFVIFEGSEVRYGLIECRGLKNTKESTIRRELTIRPGSLYRRSEVIDSQQRVYNTHLFHLVSLSLKEPDKRWPSPDFVLSVMEREARWVGVTTGIGQDEQFDLTLDVSAEWEHRNLWGTGRKIGLKGSAIFQVLTDWDNLHNRLELGYTEPWFLNTRTPLTLELYFEPGARVEERGYRIQRFGGRVDLSHEVKKSSIVTVEYVHEQVDIFDVEPWRIPQVKEDEGITVRHELGVLATRDTRDQVFAPTRGSLSQIHAGVVGGWLGGDVDVYQVMFSWSRYYPLKPSFILASRAKFNRVDGFGKTPWVPDIDRLYAGGATSVRGYGEGDLGPSDDSTGTALGGEFLLLGNAEIRFPLLWRFWGTTFVDVGQVWLKPSDVNPDDVRLTLGAGIQLFTPVGPFRLDYARRVIRRGDPPGGQLHLSVLYAF